MIISKDILKEREQIDEVFQVSINSRKLIAILKRLQDNYERLENKVAKIDQYCRDSNSVLNTKIINTTETLKDIINTQFNEAATNLQKRFQTQTEDLNKTHEGKLLEFNDLRSTIQTLTQNLTGSINPNSNDIEKETKHLSAEIASLKRYISNLQDQFFAKVEKVNCEVDKNFIEMEEKYKKLGDQFEKSINGDAVSQNERKFTFNPERYSQFAPSETSETDKQVDRKQKQKKTSSKHNVHFANSNKESRLSNSSNQLNQNYFSALQYASISAKVDTLQKTVKQQSQKLQNQAPRQSAFKRRPRNNITKTVSYSKEQFDKFSSGKRSIQKNFDDFSDGDMLSKILNKLSSIQNLVDAKQKKMNGSIEQVKEKFLLVDEKHDFNKQKIAKVVSQIQEIKVKFTQLTEKQSEFSPNQVWVSTIENQIGKIIQRLDHELHSKDVIKLEVYNVDKNKTIEKFKIIQESLAYKAEKDDVKKAITFLQQKIKQIILVMAHQFNEQKLGAANKQPVKCLTCDREVYKQQKITQVTSSTSAKGFTQRKQSAQSSRTHLTRLLSPKNLIKSSSRRSRLNYTVVTQMPQQQVETSPFD